MGMIETKRCQLRLFKETDLNDFYTYAKVEGVGERAGWFHHRSIDETKAVLAHFIEQKDVFAIVLKEQNKVIGSIGLHDREKNPKVLELGYVLSKDYWGQGLMTEAVQGILDYAFTVLDLEAITCGHFIENKASQRIIEKVGFMFIESGKYYSKNMNQEFDHKKYLLSKERYLRLKEDRILKSMSHEERYQLFPITLKEFNEHWQGWYDEIAEKIKAKVQGNVLRMNHIGSTAIHGLTAKPTIDILLEIDHSTELNELKEDLFELGFRYHHQPSNPPPHMMFTKGYTLKGYDARVYHLHVRYLGDWDELYFKDYLNDEAKVREAYQRLKIELARMFQFDRERYTDAKTDFISEATRKARLKYGYMYKPKD